MLYSSFISDLRSQVGDVKNPIHIDWTGDSTTNVFKMPTGSFPVLDDTSTYTVKVGGTTKTETTEYTLDKTAGTLTLVSTPTNGQAVTIDSKVVHLLDSEWLSIINAVIRSLGDDFWKEFLDTSNFTTTANMLSLSLVASQPLCIAVSGLGYRRNTSEDWINVEDFTNWRYDRENNVIYFGLRTAFPNNSELIRVRGLKTYDIGDAVSDTLDIQDKFLTILEYGCVARYWKWRYKDVVELVSKITQESTRTPLQELIMLSDRFDRLYELEKAKLKPQKPPRVIPTLREEFGVA